MSRGRSSRRNRTAEVWSETEVDYKARDDLIPNLEETLKIYAFPQREGSETHAEQTTPSPPPVAVPGPTGRQGGSERAQARQLGRGELTFGETTMPLAVFEFTPIALLGNVPRASKKPRQLVRATCTALPPQRCSMIVTR